MANYLRSYLINLLIIGHNNEVQMPEFYSENLPLVPGALEVNLVDELRTNLMDQ